MEVKGFEFKEPNIRDSYERRAVLFRNNIIETLRNLNLTEDDLDIPLQRLSRAKGKAFVEFYFEKEYMYFSYNQRLKFVENLYVVSKVVELAVKKLLSEKIELKDFINLFSEDPDIEQKRKESRDIIGVEHDCLDLDLINKNYKKLAKEHHPDMGGDMESFKKINNAHKMLKRELE